jgi:hypothetical protein
MPTTLTCPKCATTLTSKQAIPAGKSITCPKCKTAFSAPGEDDLPDAVLVDEPEPKSRRSGRRADDEDDDRPRVDRKPRPVDDDKDDDRPRSRRRSREDDEEDERPRSRRSRRDDDDRPARRKKKRLNPLLIILPIAAVLLFIAIGLGVYFFALGGGGSVPQPDLMAWAPAESTTATYLDYQALRNNPNVDQTQAFGLGRVPLYGLDPGQVDAVLLTGEVFSGVRVIRLKTGDAAAIDRAIASQGGQEVKVGGKSTFRTQKVTLYRASDRLLVASDDPDYLAKRIGNDEGKVIVSSRLKEFLGRASGTIWNARVVAKNGTMTINGEQVEGAMTCVTLNGGRGERVVETLFADTAAAARAADKANAAYTQVNIGQVSRSGRRVTARLPAEGNVSMMEFIHGLW